jgi:ATP-dependent protease HslVU (ClpYQ) peptidase subunit
MPRDKTLYYGEITMTTIAYNYKEGEIAVDSRVSTGDLISSDKYNKTRKLQGVTFVFAGLVADVDLLVESYPYGYEGMTELEAYALAIDEGEVYQCTIHDGKYNVTPITFNMCLGSGGDFALSAMDFGCSAKDAVKYAMTRDMCTGGRVKVIKVK